MSAMISELPALDAVAADRVETGRVLADHGQNDDSRALADLTVACEDSDQDLSSGRGVARAALLGLAFWAVVGTVLWIWVF